MSDLNQYLESKLNEVKNLIQTQSPKGIIKVFREVISKVNNITLFYDFVGNTFATDPVFFMEKFLKIYHIYITNLLNPDQVLEMEAQILQKYSLYQDEKIKDSFHGEIEVGAGRMVGRIYLTTFRIILIGTNKSKVPWLAQSFVGIAMDLTIQKLMVRNLQAKQTVSTELPCLGHQFPMFGLLKIKLGSRKVTYKVLLESTSASGIIKKNKYLLRVLPHGPNRVELAKLVHDTIIEADKNFS